MSRDTRLDRFLVAILDLCKLRGDPGGVKILTPPFWDCLDPKGPSLEESQPNLAVS